MKGQVIKSTGSWYDVKTEIGQIFQVETQG